MLRDCVKTVLILPKLQLGGRCAQSSEPFQRFSRWTLRLLKVKQPSGKPLKRLRKQVAANPKLKLGENESIFHAVSLVSWCLDHFTRA